MPDQLTPTGLVTQTATEIKADLDTAFKAVYGESIGSDPGGAIPPASSIGQEVAIIADAKSSSSEMIKSILAAYDPAQAEDTPLDVLCALTGTRRKKATFSTVLETCFGTIGTTLPTGRVLTVQSLGTRFDSQAPDATLAAVAANWAAATPYARNDLVNSGGFIWQCVAGGTSAMPAPTGAGQQADGGGVLWYRICPSGKGVALVQYIAEQTGPLAAAQGQLNQIATPVSGWDGAVNALGTDSPANGLGSNLEGNAALRVRRVAELKAQGGGPADSIRAAILALDNVIACQVFVNSGDLADADGIPGHSVCVMILAPSVDDQTLANAVWKAVGAGTGTANTIGTPVSKTVIDASGSPQTVRFSRPTAVPIFVQATVYYDPLVWTSPNPAAAIIAGAESAIGTFAEAYYQSGFDVRVMPLAAAVKFEPSATETDNVGNITPIIPAPDGSSAMPGIVDVDLQIKKSGGAFSYSPITLTKGEIATFDPGDMTITPSSEAP